MSISIHAPREGSDFSAAVTAVRAAHFYPRSPRGERRHHHRRDLPSHKHFYPRSPRGERRIQPSAPGSAPNFYPRSPRGERRFHRGVQRLIVLISIHAPREGSDFGEDIDNCPRNIFLSTLPARGATRPACGSFPAAHRFLSTLPARGATVLLPQRLEGGIYFYPRSPRGERLRKRALSSTARWISIHAPREGSDPCRCNKVVSQVGISIHAPREGSDL